MMGLNMFLKIKTMTSRVYYKGTKIVMSE
jgi:hypothetical protein